MARISIFADESGQFDFSRKAGASRYFILTTVTCRDYSVGNALMDLRRELVWDGLGGGSEFHATDNQWPIRNHVFDVMDKHDFRIDATILEKAKAQPRVRSTDERFYKFAWYYHLKHLVPRVTQATDTLFVVAASLGTKAKRRTMHDAVKDVVEQVSPTLEYRTASWSCASEPCLVAADYCAWAIGRKWEHGLTDAYDRIQAKVRSEYDLWRPGTTLYY